MNREDGDAPVLDQMELVAQMTQSDFVKLVFVFSVGPRTIVCRRVFGRRRRFGLNVDDVFVVGQHFAVRDVRLCLDATVDVNVDLGTRLHLVDGGE